MGSKCVLKGGCFCHSHQLYYFFSVLISPSNTTGNQLSFFLLPFGCYGKNHKPQLVLSVPLSCPVHKPKFGGRKSLLGLLLGQLIAHQSTIHNYSSRVSPNRVHLAASFQSLEGSQHRNEMLKISREGQRVARRRRQENNLLTLFWKCFLRLSGIYKWTFYHFVARVKHR